MALTWTVTSIPNHDRVTTAPFRREGKTQWHPATESLVWLSLHCGFSQITDKNVDDVADRIRVWQQYLGAQYSNRQGELRLSLQDIHDHIGLSTNASTLTKREFKEKIWRIMDREARLSSDSIDTQIRRGSFKTQVDEIATLVRQYEGVTEDIDIHDQIWHWFETAEDISIPQADIAAQVAQTIVHA